MKSISYQQVLPLGTFDGGPDGKEVFPQVTTAFIKVDGYRHNEPLWRAHVEVEASYHVSAETARKQLVENLRRAADLIEQGDPIA